MKNLVKNAFLFFFFLSDILLFVSCDKNKSTKAAFSNQNNISTNTDDAINCDSSLVNIDTINLSDYNSVCTIHKDNLKNSDQSNTNTYIIISSDSIRPPTLSYENNEVLEDINGLIILLNYYESQDFDDCTTVEKSVNEFTHGFFSVIEKIDINDTISIAKLRELEHFLVVFEDDFDRVEKDCPNLYNDYMEYLDELIDIHYQKLELLFGDAEIGN